MRHAQRCLLPRLIVTSKCGALECALARGGAQGPGHPARDIGISLTTRRHVPVGHVVLFRPIHMPTFKKNGSVGSDRKSLNVAKWSGDRSRIGGARRYAKGCCHSAQFDVPSAQRLIKTSDRRCGANCKNSSRHPSHPSTAGRHQATCWSQGKIRVPTDRVGSRMCAVRPR